MSIWSHLLPETALFKLNTDLENMILCRGRLSKPFPVNFYHLKVYPGVLIGMALFCLPL